MESNKRTILNISKFFVAILLIITFFSNTIYDMNIPSVVVEFPVKGTINKSTRLTGVVEFAQSSYFYADLTGKIEVFVKEGDVIAVGQELFRIEPNLDQLHETVDALSFDAEINELNLKRANADKIYYENYLKNLDTRASDEIDSYDTSEFDAELTKLEKDIQIKEQELADIKILYDAGIITLNEVIQKQNIINTLNLEYQQLLQRRSKAIEDYNKAHTENQEDIEKNIEAQKNEINKTIQNYEFQIQEAELKQKSIQNKMTRLQQQIENGGEIKVYSESEGIVKAVMNNIENGKVVSQNELILTIGLTEAPYKIVASLSESVDYISVGNKVSINIPSKKRYNIDGIITRMYYENNSLKVEVEFEAKNMTGGESANFTAGKYTFQAGLLLPNNAIYKDGGGYYVLYAEKVKTAFGHDFIAQKIKINVQSEDDKNTAFTFSSDERTFPVIVNSDKPISEGSRIKIVDGSDLVEIR